MDDARTQIARESGCAHVYQRPTGPYLKCTGCGRLTVRPFDTYQPTCPDCEFETHRCGHCGQTLDHTMIHACPKAYG